MRDPMSHTEELPAPGSVLDVIPSSTGDAFMGWMEAIDGEEFLVTAPPQLGRHTLQPEPGERIDVVWRVSVGLQALPCELVAVEPGEQSRWRLRRAGATQRGQRRDAVRAPMSLPVR